MTTKDGRRTGRPGGFFRALGVVLLAVALATVALKVGAGARGWTLGEIWFAAHPESLNLTQAVIQRYVHPTVWDPVLQTALIYGTPSGLGFLGGAVFLFGWLRGRMG